MLLQSQAGEIELLPALPSAWPDGKVSGLRARGGFEVGVKWTDEKLSAATIRNVSAEGKIKVRYGGKVVELNLKKGESKDLKPDLL
jgi:alpha-L-fucosidase 2